MCRRKMMYDIQKNDADVFKNKDADVHKNNDVDMH